MSDHLPEQSKWEDLQQSWQASPDQPLPELARLLKRRSWIIWAMTISDAIGTTLMVAAAVWVLAHKPTDFEAEVAIVVLVAVALTWAVVLTVRRGTWRLQTAAPAAMLDLSIRRCRASILLAILTQYAVLASIIYGLVSRFLLENRSYDLGIDPETKALLRIGLVIAMACMLAGAQWYKRRKRAEQAKLEKLKDQLGP